jgi:deoxyribodipyrimidine photo-lyase
MSLDSPPAVWWVRRDFRLCDNPALHAAVEDAGTILPLFIVDPVLQRSPGAGRGPWLRAALAALDSDLRRGGAPGLNVVGGRPSEVIPRIVQQSGAQRADISADFAPYGRRRDAAVQRALARAGKELGATGSPYAIAPGNLYNEAGQPFQVFPIPLRLACSGGAAPRTRRCGRVRGVGRG